MRRRVLLAGGSGYIGRAVLKELVRRGHAVLALVRPGQTLGETGCEELAVNVLDGAGLQSALRHHQADVVISCLASRSGVPRDAWLVDHDANQNLLKATQSLGAGHFMLLSALCVQKPKLAFQQAKLAFEASLAAAPVRATVIRPTAFFKSLAGQVESVRAGRPFLVFGNGELTACKPISEGDLARFMADHLEEGASGDRTLPIGGPGPALTPRQQGQMIFDLVGKPAQFRSVPPLLLSTVAAALGPLGAVSRRIADKAALARIGHYYATESMLVWDAASHRYDAAATPETGRETLRAFYARVLEEGLAGQELGAHRMFREVKKKP